MEYFLKTGTSLRWHFTRGGSKRSAWSWDRFILLTHWSSLFQRTERELPQANHLLTLGGCWLATERCFESHCWLHLVRWKLYYVRHEPELLVGTETNHLHNNESLASIWNILAKFKPICWQEEGQALNLEGHLAWKTSRQLFGSFGGFFCVCVCVGV